MSGKNVFKWVGVIFGIVGLGLLVGAALAVMSSNRFLSESVRTTGNVVDFIESYDDEGTLMYTPVFAGRQGDDLIGFFAVNCHWIDIGGSAIGSVSYSSTDIFMEGLQLRSIKIWSKGEPIEEPSIPASFRVLVKELQSLGLAVEAVTDTAEVIRFGKDEERTRPPKLATGLLGLGEEF